MIDEIANYSEIYDSKNHKYDVSICILSYNQSSFLDTAIKSVLKQDTDLSYEIVIGDNCSQDGSQAMLKEYWQSNPDVFCLLLNKENYGVSQNLYNVLCKAKGEYLIILYGDDYWTDKSKIDLQYNFLQSNKDFFGVTTPIGFIYDGESEMFYVLPKKFLWNTEMTLDKYLLGYDFPMAGLMFRARIFNENRSHFYKMVQSCKTIDDASFCILVLQLGKVFILGSVTAAYRCFKKNQSASNFNAINSTYQKSVKHIRLYNELNKLSENCLDLRTRYGLILATAAFALIRKKLSIDEYKKIVDEIDPKYASISNALLIKGILKKIELKVRV